MKANMQERATILAALRHWQKFLADHGEEVTTSGCSYSEHFKDEPPMSIEEIDELCERVNIKGKKK